MVSRTIWFDFENAPHVWVLKPLIDHFAGNGYRCYCSARDFSYTIKLLKRAGIQAEIQRTNERKNKMAKILNLMVRTIQLIGLYRNRKIDLAIGHGSRSQILAARILGIPVISMDDYEKSDQFLVRLTTKTLVPDIISKANWGRYQNRIVHYPGLKENIYLDDHDRDDAILTQLGVDRTKVIVLLRPETISSHYYSRKSTELLFAIMNYLTDHKNIEILLLPRNTKQREEISGVFEKFKIRCTVPDPEKYGFEMVDAVDLVIGGGGTMLREAACLGVPAYSYFSGQWGGVDDHLISLGRLWKISSEKEINRIKLVKRHRTLPVLNSSGKIFIIRFIEKYLELLP